MSGMAGEASVGVFRAVEASAGTRADGAAAKALSEKGFSAQAVASRRLLAKIGAGAGVSFRARLDDYLTQLMRGELEAAVEAHFAPEAKLYENGVLRAQGLSEVLRKIAPVARRHAMLRGTLDGLDCDRFSGTARFRIRFDGVDIDGRLVRDEVELRQIWHLGRIVEEHQERGAGRRSGGAARGVPEAARAPLVLVAGASAML
jgi:hypothetical protein